MERVRFSANLGMLWTELSLPEAIHAAARAGFAAVECQWPQATDPREIRAALSETGLPLLSLNTDAGNRAAGDFGLCALPGQEAEARAAILEAVGYARATGARAVHVMSGVAEGPEARAAFEAALGFACREAPDLTLLIEPINRLDVPGYFLGSVERALEIRAAVGAENLAIMADCYHLAQMGHDVVAMLERLRPALGHVQIAGHPGRGAPDTGTLDYGAVFAALERLGWDGYVGAESLPRGPTEETLGWLGTRR
jgi:hydroxypyruvate isomerase